MGAGAMHPGERLGRLLGAEARGVGDHHLGEPDDGVERGAQLMAHAGEKLRLVLARELQLPALVLDLVEQPHVLDRDHRLVGEGGRKPDLLIGEGSDLQTLQDQHADGDQFPQQRKGKNASRSGDFLDVGARIFGIAQNVGNLDRAAFQHRPSEHRSAIRFDRMRAHIGTVFARHPQLATYGNALPFGR